MGRRDDEDYNLGRYVLALVLSLSLSLNGHVLALQGDPYLLHPGFARKSSSPWSLHRALGRPGRFQLRHPPRGRTSAAFGGPCPRNLKGVLLKCSFLMLNQVERDSINWPEETILWASHEKGGVSNDQATRVRSTESASFRHRGMGRSSLVERRHSSWTFGVFVFLQQCLDRGGGPIPAVVLSHGRV